MSRCQPVLVSAEEPGEDPGNDRRRELLACRGSPVDPLPARQVSVPPTRCVEGGHLADRRDGDGGIASVDLVALGGAVHVLEQEGEPRLVGVQRREQHPRQARPYPRRHLEVEAHFDLVGPHDLPGGMTHGVLGCELSHHAGRADTGWFCMQVEADRVGHLSGADRFG